MQPLKNLGGGGGGRREVGGGGTGVITYINLHSFWFLDNSYNNLSFSCNTKVILSVN